MVAASSDFVVAVTGSESCRNGVKVLLRKSGVAVMVFCGGDGGTLFFFRDGGYGFRCCSKARSRSQ
ncbi:hypothetical protein DEO72_LG7g1444 [Vigna unguiculata]|uniref:Uncharacterized protein n=1 Tax=Vigna unguiculata TaxID=3917 RepID=A0A4D6MJI5_VIGUN|nr:hypothetical protein DEO72_LG7g1444 [Vigna unguiculata]